MVIGRRLVIVQTVEAIVRSIETDKEGLRETGIAGRAALEAIDRPDRSTVIATNVLSSERSPGVHHVRLTVIGRAVTSTETVPRVVTDHLVIVPVVVVDRRAISGRIAAVPRTVTVAVHAPGLLRDPVQREHLAPNEMLVPTVRGLSAVPEVIDPEVTVAVSPDEAIGHSMTSVRLAIVPVDLPVVAIVPVDLLVVAIVPVDLLVVAIVPVVLLVVANVRQGIDPHLIATLFVTAAAVGRRRELVVMGPPPEPTRLHVTNRGRARALVAQIARSASVHRGRKTRIKVS